MALIGMGAGAIAMILIAGVSAWLTRLIEAFTGASPGKRVMGCKSHMQMEVQETPNCTCCAGPSKTAAAMLQLVLPIISSLVSLVFFLRMLCRAWRQAPSPARHHLQDRRSTRKPTSRANPSMRFQRPSTVGQDQPAEADRRVVHAVVHACAVADVPLPLSLAAGSSPHQNWRHGLPWASTLHMARNRGRTVIDGLAHRQWHRWLTPSVARSYPRL